MEFKITIGLVSDVIIAFGEHVIKRFVCVRTCDTFSLSFELVPGFGYIINDLLAPFVFFILGHRLCIIFALSL